MPAITSTDLVKRMTGEADRGGGYVLSPSGFDPYEPGGVKSATAEVSGSLVNGSSPGFHNAVCFENHQAGKHKHVVAEVALTMGASAAGFSHNPSFFITKVVRIAIADDANAVTTYQLYFLIFPIVDWLSRSAINRANSRSPLYVSRLTDMFGLMLYSSIKPACKRVSSIAPFRFRTRHALASCSDNTFGGVSSSAEYFFRQLMIRLKSIPFSITRR